MAAGTLHDVLSRRRCLVCEFAYERWEPEDTDEIGPPCARCHAPSEHVERLAGLVRRQSEDVEQKQLPLGKRVHGDVTAVEQKEGRDALVGQEVDYGRTDGGEARGAVVL